MDTAKSKAYPKGILKFGCLRLKQLKTVYEVLFMQYNAISIWRFLDSTPKYRPPIIFAIVKLTIKNKFK